MSVHVLNLAQELVPLTGAGNVTLTATGTSANLTTGVTLAAGCEVVMVQPQGGDLRFTTDGTAPTTTAGMLLYDGGILQMHVGAASAFKYCGNGSDTPSLVVSQHQYAASSVRRAADLSVSIDSKRFIDVASWVIRRWNGNPVTWLADGSTTADDKQSIVDGINDAVRKLWNRGPWPFLTLTEERELDDTLDYKLVPHAETGYLNLGQVFGVWSADPRLQNGTAAALDFTAQADGILLPADTGASVWVRHRIRAHEFTLEAYAGGTTYAAGALVYYASTGECYRRLSAGSGVSPVDLSTWEVMRIPSVFASFVQMQALADLLASRKPKDADYWLSRAADEEYRAVQSLPLARATVSTF